jgi:hypothetical protein
MSREEIREKGKRNTNDALLSLAIEIADAWMQRRAAFLTPFQAIPLRPAPPTKTSSPSGKDADPDIPILKEAKAEYAKMQ